MAANRDLLRIKKQELKERFKQLYEVDRKRFDDVIEDLVKEFKWSRKTINNYLFYDKSKDKPLTPSKQLEIFKNA